jgi:uncharacterized protein YodC (DUF2158 family)
MMSASRRSRRHFDPRRAVPSGLIIALLCAMVPMLATEPVDAQIGHRISVQALECPAGFDPSVGAEAAVQQCSLAIAGMEFSLSVADPLFVAQAGLTDAEGHFVFDEVTMPPGGYAIVETMGSGYGDPWVQCAYDDGLAVQERYAQAPGGTMTAPDDVAGHFMVSCKWFNVPTAETAFVQSDLSAGAADIGVFFCPAGLDPAVAGRDELATACATGQPDSGVALSGSEDFFSLRYTGADGRVGWSVAPAGTIAVDYLASSGAEAGATYCAEQPVGSESPPETWNPVGLGDSFETQVQAGNRLVCEIYVAERVFAPGTVVIRKHLCPPGFELAGADAAGYQENCTIRHSGQQFRATRGEEELGRAPTDPDGWIEFSGLSGGPVRVAELPKEGWPPPVAFCQTYAAGSQPPGSFAQAPIANWGFEAGLQEGAVIDCAWYNVPPVDESLAGQDATLLVQKFVCSDLVDLSEGAPFEAYEQSCTEPQPGVAFDVVTASGQAQSVTTDGQGQATTSVAPELLRLVETPPDGAATLDVLCRTYPTGSTAAGALYRIERQANTAAAETAGGYTLECRWYDVVERIPAGLQEVEGGQTEQVEPSPTPEVSESPTAEIEPTPTSPAPETTPEPTQAAALEPGLQAAGASIVSTPGPDESQDATLIIRTFACEPDYDLHAPEANPEADCDEPADNLLFTLEGPDDVEAIGITGEEESGAATFTGLPAGSYVVTEALPEETLAAFVGSCTSDRRALFPDNPFIPLAYAGPDGGVGITLVAGETLACDWYHVPGGEEAPDDGTPVAGTPASAGDGELIVTKFWCPDALTPSGDCPVYTGGAEFLLFDVDNPDGEPIVVETDDTGSVTLAIEGRFAIQEDEPRTICRTESLGFDFGGNLVVEAGQSVELNVYNCGPEPGS